MGKKFKDLSAGDYIHFLAMESGEIKNTKIVKIVDTKSKHHRGFKVYKNLTDKAPNITIDRLELIKEDMNNSIYQLLILDTREETAIVEYKGLPTAVATSKEAIQLWMERK